MTVTNLTEILTKLAAKSERLEAENERLQAELTAHENVASWSWARHRIVRADDYPAELPIPRLQLEIIELDERGYNWAWRYELIYRHYSGELIAVPLGLTRTSGPREESDEIGEPWRESFHIRSDAAQLGLRAFKVHGDRWAELSSLEDFIKSGKA